MKIAIISDIHSNITALEAVWKDILKQGVDRIDCLGDIVGYYTHPLECLGLVAGFNGNILQGNHEACVADPILSSELNDVAREGVNYSRSKLNDKLCEYLGKLPLIKDLEEHDMVLCHGSFSRPEQFEYLDSPYKAKEELKKINRRICVIGHTHKPFVFDNRKGLYDVLPDNLELLPDRKFIVNVGSVGQSRDGDVRASYGIFTINDKKITFDLRRVFYDLSKVDEDVRKAGLPRRLAERLYTGE